MQQTHAHTHVGFNVFQKPLADFISALLFLKSAGENLELFLWLISIRFQVHRKQMNFTVIPAKLFTQVASGKQYRITLSSLHEISSGSNIQCPSRYT